AGGAAVEEEPDELPAERLLDVVREGAQPQLGVRVGSRHARPIGGAIAGCKHTAAGRGPVCGRGARREAGRGITANCPATRLRAPLTRSGRAATARPQCPSWRTSAPPLAA